MVFLLLYHGEKGDCLPVFRRWVSPLFEFLMLMQQKLHFIIRGKERLYRRVVVIGISIKYQGAGNLLRHGIAI